MAALVSGVDHRGRSGGGPLLVQRGDDAFRWLDAFGASRWYSRDEAGGMSGLLTSTAHHRADIDGLRALAVIPVLLYHAGFSTFPGGFIGVDVFFVISGYLITSIILNDLQGGKFSIAHFYERRIRRIFPALFFLVIVTMAAGYFLLLPDDLKNLGRSAIATTLFASNMLFWSESGYFDRTAEQKPLLHTWSLSVEEQFYLGFPIFLLVIFRASRHPIWYVVGLLVMSFAAAVWSVANAPSAAFYLAPLRAWELLLGVTLAMGAIPLPRRQAVRDGLSLIGVGLIVASVLTLSPETPFPGAAALPACLGTCLVIHSGSQGQSVAGRLLGARALVFVGLISYSLYLWHWPVLLFAKFYVLRELTSLETLVALASSVMLAAASWRFIERPFRTRRPRLERPHLFAAAALVMCLTVALGLVLDRTRGLLFRLSSDVARLAAGVEDRDQRPECRELSFDEVRAGRLCGLGVGKSTGPTFLLWGDSHADALRDVVGDAASKAGRAGLFASYPNCPPLPGVTVRSPDSTVPQHCRAFNEAVRDLVLRSDIETVILAARWSMYATGVRAADQWRRQVYLGDGLAFAASIDANAAIFRRGIEATVAALAKAGKEVVIVAPIPEVAASVPSTLALAAWHGWHVDIRPTRASFDSRHRIVLSALARLSERSLAKVVYPHLELCDAFFCRVESAGRALYYDDNHLSLYGALMIQRIFDRTFHDFPRSSSKAQIDQCRPADVTVMC